MYAKLESNKNQLGRYYYLFVIMFLNGTRVSETLGIQHTQIISTGEVYLNAHKGSNNRLLNVGLCSEYLVKCKADKVNPFYGMNRQGAYRILKGLGISSLKTGRVHESVTHVFRNEYVKRLRELNLSNNDLSKITGHKVSKNVEYYGKD